MARTQEQRRADTRHRLLRAAAERFAVDGFAAASVDGIADDADRTSGSIYAHFGDKDGLVAGVLDGWKNEVASVVAAEFMSSSTLDEKLRTLWRSFVEPPGEDGRHWVQLEHELWLYVTRHPERADALAARYRDAWADIDRAVEWWADRGEIHPPVAPTEVAPLLVALLVGLEMQHRILPQAVTEEVAVAGLRAVLGAGAPTPLRRPR